VRQADDERAVDSPLKLASDTVDANGEARVSLTITNTGKRRGTGERPAMARRSKKVAAPVEFEIKLTRQPMAQFA